MTLWWEDSPGDFLHFAVATAAALCTRNKGSTWITQDPPVSSSYSYSPEPPNPDKHPTSPAEPSPSLLHSQVHSRCEADKPLGKKPSQRTQQSCGRCFHSSHFSYKTKQLFNPAFCRRSLESGSIFNGFCLFIYFSHSLSSFLFWIKLTAHYVPGCATQTRMS